RPVAVGVGEMQPCQVGQGAVRFRNGPGGEAGIPAEVEVFQRWQVCHTCRHVAYEVVFGQAERYDMPILPGNAIPRADIAALDPTRLLVPCRAVRRGVHIDQRLALGLWDVSHCTAVGESRRSSAAKSSEPAPGWQQRCLGFLLNLAQE